MKRAHFFAGTLLLAIFSGSGPARGAFLVNVFENGTLTYSINGGPSITVKALLQKDPTAGEDNRLVPTFLVADQVMRVVSGDLILDEPGGGTSDVLRFLSPNAPKGPSELLFYSDFEAGEGASTFDVGLPLTVSNPFHATEQGPEGNNGFQYTPTRGQPGFFLNVPNNITYNIFSDVPEPGSGVLLALGLGLGAFARSLAGRRMASGGAIG
jgi:hypothetical protein